MSVNLVNTFPDACIHKLGGGVLLYWNNRDTDLKSYRPALVGACQNLTELEGFGLLNTAQGHNE